MKKSQYNLEQSFGYIVGRAGRAIANRLNQNFESAGYDVTCEQWAILNSLWKKNGQSQKELAGCTCKDKTSITRLLDGMQKRKLVTRVADKNDARQNLILLTEKGKNLRLKLLRRIEKTLQEAQKKINAGDLQVCKNVLLHVTQNLTEGTKLN